MTKAEQFTAAAAAVVAEYAKETAGAVALFESTGTPTSKSKKPWNKQKRHFLA